MHEQKETSTFRHLFIYSDSSPMCMPIHGFRCVAVRPSLCVIKLGAALACLAFLASLDWLGPATTSSLPWLGCCSSSLILSLHGCFYFVPPSHNNRPSTMDPFHNPRPLGQGPKGPSVKGPLALRARRVLSPPKGHQSPKSLRSKGLVGIPI